MEKAAAFRWQLIWFIPVLMKRNLQAYSSLLIEFSAHTWLRAMVVRMGNTDDVNTWLLGMTSWLSHSMYSLVMQTLTKLELLKIKFSKLKHNLTDNAKTRWRRGSKDFSRFFRRSCLRTVSNNSLCSYSFTVFSTFFSLFQMIQNFNSSFDREYLLKVWAICIYIKMFWCATTSVSNGYIQWTMKKNQ